MAHLSGDPEQEMDTRERRVPSDVCISVHRDVPTFAGSPDTQSLQHQCSVLQMTVVPLPYKQGQAQARILIALSADQPTLWTIWELVWDAKRPQMVCVQQEKITPQNCLTPPSEVKNRQLYARRKKTKQVGQEPSVFCGNTWQASPCISLSKHHCQSRAGVKELYSLNRAACQTPSL